MTAELLRKTKTGIHRFSVVVEQPYPEHVPDPALSAEPPGNGSPGSAAGGL
jgi:hypothetical protein